MTSNKYLPILLLVAISILPACRAAGALVLTEDRLDNRPNIILIMADDLGYECLSCNGGESYQTPRLDAMAAEGLRFTQCHSQPVCTPTRVQIMTGRCNSRNYWAFGSLHPKELTFGHVLKAAGYATCITGKWQLSGRGQRFPGTHPDQSGFDEWCLWELDEETRGSRYWNPTIKANGKLVQNTQGKFGPDIFCDYLLDFISRHKTKPFFAYYPMALTHGPTHPTPDTPGYDPATKPKRDAKYFADMVNYTDKIVGRVLDQLEREGLAENTLVLFTGDNGTDKKLTSKFQGRVVQGGKGRKLDVSTHVPLIASWKGTLQSGQVCNNLIDFSDMMPTFCELATAQVPAGLRFDGVSFLPQLRGESGNPKPYIYCFYEKGKYDGDLPDSPDNSPVENSDVPVSEKKAAKQLRKSQPTRWVHDGRWKLLNSGSFFDLKNDPDERSPIPNSEAGREGESKRALFQRVLDEKSANQKVYGPAEVGSGGLKKRMTERQAKEKADGASQPNIVLLLTDDQVYNSLGYTGNKQVVTPNLDQLAADGVVFDSAYDTTSICMASRAQVMTGMYEYKTGCNFSHGPLLRDKWQKSYPVLMRNAGYQTAFVGKFGFAVKDADGNSNYHHNEDLPIDSFDYWCGWPGQGKYSTKENEFFARYAEKYPHVTQAVGAASCDFIKLSQKDDRPFCLSVSFKAPHGPMSPDPAFDDVYADTVWDMPPNYDQKGAAHIPEQAKSGRQYLTINDFEPDRYQKTMRKYHQLIYGIDKAVGMIREELEIQGLAENTVILFLTDNGYNCGAHGFGGKVMPYEEGSRSPMVIFDPRHAVSGQGKHCDALVANIDIAPTMLDLAGLPIPENMDGKTLQPLLDNPEGRVREALLLMNAWGNAPTHELAIVTDQYKYIHWPYSHEMEPKEELYNLTADRFELNNLAISPGHESVLEMMHQLYDKALQTWKNECVPEGNYPLFAKIYDRHLSWDEKLAAMDNRMRRKYLDWRNDNEKNPKNERKPKDNKRKESTENDPQWKRTGQF